MSRHAAILGPIDDPFSDDNSPMLSQRNETTGREPMLGGDRRVDIIRPSALTLEIASAAVIGLRISPELLHDMFGAPTIPPYMLAQAILETIELPLRRMLVEEDDFGIRRVHLVPLEDE